jgi:hypothetical protein
MEKEAHEENRLVRRYQRSKTRKLVSVACSWGVGSDSPRDREDFY